MQHPVIIVGLGDVICDLLQSTLCIFHGNAKTGALDHGQVVEAISAADHFIYRQVQA